MRLLIKKLRDGAQVPRRQTAYSAGYDLCACLEEPAVIRAGETVKIPTGISAELEGERDAVLLIYARSSLASKSGIAPANCVGVVDWDYRGEIAVALRNSSSQDYTVSPGDRIAQLVITPVFTPEVAVTDELSETDRGQGGFGSTGRA
ncbi:MAG: dUTP diphosphatase [Ruminococcus sp.]|nr:dUTP diphosphatase [Ruminococcus sp.]